MQKFKLCDSLKLEWKLYEINQCKMDTENTTIIDNISRICRRSIYRRNRRFGRLSNRRLRINAENFYARCAIIRVIPYWRWLFWRRGILKLRTSTENQVTLHCSHVILYHHRPNLFFEKLSFLNKRYFFKKLKYATHINIFFSNKNYVIMNSVSFFITYLKEWEIR